MLQKAFTFVTGWLSNLRFIPVEEIKPQKLTPSKKGYQFEHDEIKRLMRRLKNFQTVDFTDAEGNILTESIIEKRYGKDGGIDCVIRIVAPTEHGARIAAGKLRKIIIDGDY